MTILIRNGRVIDPAQHSDEVGDILICNGIIEASGRQLEADADQIIDAGGKWVVPGLIDLHVHFRDPGYTHKETIATGSRSAAMGGFTTVCCMPNTKPVTDCAAVVEEIKEKAKREGIVNVLPVGAITKGQGGEALADIADMARAGICALSEDGKTVENAALMKQALQMAAALNLPVFSHCEDIDLAGDGQVNEGPRAEHLGLAGISNDSEEVIVSRDAILARSVKARLHICHASARGSVRVVRTAKSRLQDITAEVTPHHFTLIDEDIPESPHGNYKMSPPLRSRKDREALLNALRDGTIDVIATDHAPHHADEKNQGFAKALNGIVGLETAFALSYTELIDKNVLTPLELIEKMSTNPAKILGINRGTLAKGSVADIAIFDVDTEYAVDVNAFASMSKNSPFHGRLVRGKTEYTIVGGRIVVEKGRLVRCR